MFGNRRRSHRILLVRNFGRAGPFETLLSIENVKVKLLRILIFLLSQRFDLRFKVPFFPECLRYASLLLKRFGLLYLL